MEFCHRPGEWVTFISCNDGPCGSPIICTNIYSQCYFVHRHIQQCLIQSSSLANQDAILSIIAINGDEKEMVLLCKQRKKNYISTAKSYKSFKSVSTSNPNMGYSALPLIRLVRLHKAQISGGHNMFLVSYQVFMLVQLKSVLLPVLNRGCPPSICAAHTGYVAQILAWNITWLILWKNTGFWPDCCATLCGNVVSVQYLRKTGANLECTGPVQKKNTGDWPDFLLFIIKSVAHLML